MAIIIRSSQIRTMLFLLMLSLFSSIMQSIQGFSTSALSSVIDPSIDTCLADPEGWIKGPVTSAALQSSIAKVLTPGHNASFHWGTYQPNQYFAIKSRTAPISLSSGILWHGAGGSAARARSECKQDDGLKKYGWTHHDGRRYGRQVIEDSAQDVKLVTEYVRLSAGDNRQHQEGFWASRVHVSTYSKGRGKEQQEGEVDGPVTFLYLALDCDGSVNPRGCLGVGGSDGLSIQIERKRDRAAALILGSTNDLGAFTLEVAVSSLKKESPLSVTYFGGSALLLADLKGHIEAEQRKSVKVQGDARNQLGPLEVWSLSDTAEPHSNIIVLRIAGEGPYQIDSMLRPQDLDEEETDVDDVPKLAATIDKATAQGLSDFDSRFEEIFQLEGKGYKNRKFTPAEMEAAKAAFSNMIGGVGYFHGHALIQATEGRDVLESFATSLFTAVPSRSFFPRGFLWDEGFHQLLLHKWDLGLTYDVLLHWLSLMHVHANCSHMGWIPRELALGTQSIRRIPQEFLPQDVSVANPPTFLFTVEKILALTEGAGGGGQCEAGSKREGDDEKEEGEARQCELRREGKGDEKEEMAPILKREEFLMAIQDRMERWIKWLISSQRGEVQGAFRWRGRGDKREKLMATTFASGLDDYPRASEPGPEEYHLDLLCWVIKGCQILSRLSKATGQAKEEEKYQQIAQELLIGLDSLHWNETLGGYFDYGKHSEDGHMDNMMPIRCGDEGGQKSVSVLIPESLRQQFQQVNPCPKAYPRFLGVISPAKETYIRKTIVNQHVPRVGYVNLFPFLLGLLPVDSPHLGPLLETLQDPKQLWSPYGIRSLSASDVYYAKENAPGDAPYWRGYIWININYLALRALWRLSQTKGPYQADASKIYRDADASKIYRDLRDNLLSTILGQYEASGYFWEQYHDQTGQGMRCHPFTGWTALVVNIMAEDY